MDEHTTHRMLPVVAVVAVVVLGLNIVLTSTVDHGYLAPLLLPLSALLGYRLGIRGVALIVACGIVLIPELRLSDWARFEALFDLYLISIAIGIVAASRKPLGNFLPQGDSSKILLLLMILMPLNIGIWGREVGDAELRLVITFRWVGFAALFMAGIAHVRSYKVALTLTGLVVASLLFDKLELGLRATDYFDADRAELPLLGIAELRATFVSYRIAEVTAVIVGLFFFAAGRLCGPYLRSGDAPMLRYSVIFIALLAVVAADLLPLKSVARGLDWLVEAFVSLWRVEAEPVAAAPGEIMVRARRSDYAVAAGLYLVPLLGFMAALLLRVRGFFITLAALTLLLAIHSIRGQYFPNMVIPLATGLLMLGFGALGTAVRNRVSGSADRWWSSAWAVYIVIVLAISAQLGVTFSSVYLPLTIAAAGGVGVAAQRLLIWLRGNRLQQNTAWVALSILVFTISAVWGHFGEMSGAMLKLLEAATVGEMIDDLETWIPLALLTVFILWLVLTALQVLIKRIPACAADIRQLVRAASALIHRRPMPVDPDIEEQTAAEPAEQALPAVRAVWWHPATLLQGLRSTVLYGGLLVVVASIGRPIVAEIDEYHEDQNEVTAGHTSDDTSTNPYLMRSAKYTFEGWGIRSTEQSKYSSRFETEWNSERATPHIRQRASVRIGSDLDERSVSVRIYMQTKSHGLWVERRGDYREESAAADDLEALVYRRAQRERDRDQRVNELQQDGGT